MWRSLRGRLLLGTAAGVGVVTLLAGLVLQALVHRSVEASWTQALREELVTLQHLANALPLEQLASGRAAEPYSGEYWQIGTGLADDPVHARSPSLAGFTLGVDAETPQLAHLVGPLDEPLRAVVARGIALDGTPRTLTVARDASELNRLLARVDQQLLWGLGLVWLAAVGVAWLVAGAVARPVRRLGQDLTAMQRGQRQALRGSAVTELDALTGQFNALATQHARRLDRQRQAAATLAHELKTPLTAPMNELASQETVRSDTVMPRVQRMLPVIEDALARARIHGPAPGLPAVALRPEVRRAIDICCLDHGLAATDFEVQVPDHRTLPMERRDAYTVLWNLLDNASKHGAPPILVTADDSVALRVSSAPGAPQPDGLGGHGLSIVEAILDAYGGRMDTAVGPLGGRETRVHLPHTPD